jgi:hypothetical protein
MFKHKRIAAVVAAALVAGSVTVASTAADARNWNGNGNWMHDGPHFTPHMGNNFAPHNFVQRNFYFGQHNFGGGYGYGHHYYNDGGALAAGLLGGLFLGNALGGPYYDYEPDYYDYGPYYGAPYPGSSYCFRFKTYNPATGMYMSNHGPRHCP